MMEIPLTQGQIALVDEADYEIVAQFKWHADWHGQIHGFYACRKQRVDAGKEKTIAMHRLILNAPTGFMVDHINHDGLDNRRSNLRLCTQKQNSRNRLVCFDNQIGLKGVYFHPPHKKWCAQMKCDGRTIHLGYYETPEVAARVYDAAAIGRFGSFALTNEMLGLIPAGNGHELHRSHFATSPGDPAAGPGHSPLLRSAGTPAEECPTGGDLKGHL